MKATELIAALQNEVAANGDKEIIFAANRHSYRDAKVSNRESQTVLALFDKIED